MTQPSQDSCGFTVVEGGSYTLECQYNYNRILVEPHSDIKYLLLKSTNRDSFDPWGQRFDFTTVPTGDWQVGHLEETPSGLLRLASTSPEGLLSISPIWHPTVIDESDLPHGRALPRSIGRLALPESDTAVPDPNDDPFGGADLRDVILSTTYRDFLARPEVAVYKAWNPMATGELNNETRVYSLLQGHGVAPEFLGHVTEGRSRVIGFALEKVAGRRAEASDLEACVEALSKVHALGVACGHISEHLFVITEEGKVLLRGFPVAYQTRDAGVFEKEVGMVRKMIGDLGVKSVL